MTNVAKPSGRARIKLRVGAPFLDLEIPVQAAVTGYSEGHIRQILRGQQVGEAFIAAVMQHFPALRFESNFQLIPAAKVSAILGATATQVIVDEVIVAPEMMPHSYEDAVERFGLAPEQGPPLFEGADEFEDDRIIWRINDVPVLAFEPGVIRTYATTREDGDSLQLLASLGHTSWSGNRIRL